MPGTVLVAWAAICPLGMLPEWQLSQVAEPIGKWAPGPGLLESGMTTMLLMPVKLLPVMLGPWQAAQPVLTPPWLNLALLNLAPSTTGICTLLPAAMWQASQPWPFIPMWLLGGPTSGGTIVGEAKADNAAELWHCWQLVLVDYALAWIFVMVGITE